MLLNKNEFCKISFVLIDCFKMEKQDRTKPEDLEKVAKGMSVS
jgi:hypothetical protein